MIVPVIADPDQVAHQVILTFSLQVHRDAINRTYACCLKVPYPVDKGIWELGIDLGGL